METIQKNKKTTVASGNNQRGDASFVERAPDIMNISKGDSRISAHDLFNLFTEGIIKEKTSFIR